VTQTSNHDNQSNAYAKSDGLRIHYHVYGAGAPLLLAHGWGSDTCSNWPDTGWIEHLQSYRMVVAIDVRGHGLSDKPHALERYSYAAMSQDVLAVMDALCIERCDFMGYSMGAFMGAYLLGHHPERFISMILGGIGDETRESAAQGAVIAQALNATDQNSTNDKYGLAVRQFVESNPHNDLQALAYSAQKMWPEGYPLQIAGPDIAGARFPVLIVNGENDHPYVDSADTFAHALPNARHVQIPDSDHMTVVIDERFKRLVGEFLSAKP